ncbi:hypothetical protein BpHYR1_045791 [Brachionus plicatilis]|uniref:Uncharacterized protein n=1 Tax=Brachionus plicatilis TaxID=10195 RepID=A0A3M7P680_BRAPC|nr:hypothetical protein BpHYR1_045791 [Brachionus plicatilis]
MLDFMRSGLLAHLGASASPNMFEMGRMFSFFMTLDSSGSHPPNILLVRPPGGFITRLVGLSPMKPVKKLAEVIVGLEICFKSTTKWSQMQEILY